jgi:hypothetical protein
MVIPFTLIQFLSRNDRDVLLLVEDSVVVNVLINHFGKVLHSLILDEGVQQVLSELVKLSLAFKQSHVPCRCYRTLEFGSHG